MNVSKTDAAFTVIALVHIVAALLQAVAANWLAVCLAVLVASAAAAVPLRHRSWRKDESLDE